MRLILVIALVLSLTAPATADAGLRKRIERAQTIAAEYWGATPAQCPAVRTLRVPALMNEGAAAEAAFYSCTIYFQRDWWALRRTYFFKFCSVYVHEWGHLLGHEHTDDPRSVMYDGSVPTLEACR